MSGRPPPPERLFIEGPVGPLEAVIDRPAVVRPAGTVAVCCHPHPVYGGTLDNKVVHTLARVARDLGVPAIRFNFRGVGGSVGHYDHGDGETADALAVADWGQQAFGASYLWALGFSFGSFVACRLALAHGATRLLTVAPPVQRFDFGTMPVPQCPWLIVQGDRDELVDHAAVTAWSGKLVPAPQLALLAGADHFLHGRIAELRERAREWLGGEGES